VPVSIRPDHVAIYIRWSTDDQASGTTLEVQRESCSHYVQSQGWLVRNDLLFVDDGHSGGSLDRPAITRLREGVRRGDVDCVVVLKIDRLSRNIVDAVQLVLREWEGRCHLKSVLEPIDTTTDLGRMIFGVLAMFADFERSTIRERTQTGKVRRIREGQQMHAKPAYGYARDPDHRGRWVESPEEADVVRRLFRMACDGVPAGRIVRQLNREGIRTRAGKEWSPRAVLWILHNRTYIGEVTYGRTSLRPAADSAATGTGAAMASRRPRHKRIRVQNSEPKVQGATQAVPPLVGVETFERAQAQIQGNRVARQAMGSRATASPHLLVGIARCPCGAALIHKPESRGRSHLSGHYICTRSRYGTCRESGHIPAEAAERLVERSFLNVFGLKDMRDERFQPHLEATAKDRETIHHALQNARREIERLDAEDQRLLRQGRSGDIPLSLLGDMRASLQRDRQAVEEQIRSLAQRLSQLAVQAHSLRQTLAALGGLERWTALQPWQKRQLLRMVLADRIVISRPRGTSAIEIEIPWAFG
jgi:site-specific DNA recombinase